MRNSINYNLDMRDELTDRWWKALREMQTTYHDEFVKRMEACNGFIGSSRVAQVATLEGWLEEIKNG